MFALFERRFAGRDDEDDLFIRFGMHNFYMYYKQHLSRTVVTDERISCLIVPASIHHP